MIPASKQQAALARAARVAVTLCPQIVSAAARAGHGHPDSRMQQLWLARQLTRQLVAELEAVEREAGGNAHE